MQGQLSMLQCQNYILAGQVSTFQFVAKIATNLHLFYKQQLLPGPAAAGFHVTYFEQQQQWRGLASA